MKIIDYIILAVPVFVMTSCSSRQIENADWGETQYYSDFWWKHYEPVRMQQKLKLEFNDYAKRLITDDVVFELVVKKENGDFGPTQDLALYKNGIRCHDNKMAINTDDRDILVAVEFIRDIPEGTYVLYLNPVTTGGLDRIEQIGLQNGFTVQKIDIMNPLAKQTFWIAVIVVIFIVSWIIVARIVNPSLKFSKITFDYNDGTGEIEHRVGKYYKIVCTNKPKSITFFHKVFIGNVFVEFNEFWDRELVIRCGSRDNIRLISHGDYIFPDESVRKEMFVIKNSNHQSVNIETT